MDYTRFLINTSLVAASCMVLAVSLVSSVPRVHSASGSFASNDRQFYMDTEVLPDHVIYPMFMAMDRVKLETSTPVEQIYLQTEYANRRLSYAEQLLEKDNLPLSLTTLTKAQKYLLHAGHAVQALDVPDNVTQHVIKTIQYHQIKSKLLAERFTDTDRAAIDQLNQELLVMVDQLKSQSN